MPYYFLRYLLAIEILSSVMCLGQTQNDTTKHSYYKRHITYKPQEGYGLILGWFNGDVKLDDKEIVTKNIYTIGIAKTRMDKSGHTLLTENALLEINKTRNKTLYGLTLGGDIKATILLLGLQFNYTTDFSTNRVLAIRPRLGITFGGLGINLDAVIEYDFHIIKPNFDNINNSLGGWQYTIGMFEKQ